MKKTAFILLAAILLGLMPQGVHAQYASTGDSDLTLQKENLYTGQGQRLTDAGKTIMLTGASFAMTGLTVFLAGALTYDYDPCCPDMALYPVFGALGGIAGAAIALVGLPIYCNGKNKMQSHDATHFVFASDTQRGGAAMGEVGLGILGELSMNVTGGYHFNKHVFLGGGLGFKKYLFFDDAPKGAPDALPVYANARFTLGSKRVAPYVSTSFGYDLASSNVYTGFEFGSRIRKINSTKDSSWWLGTKTELIGDEVSFLSIKLGKTF